MSVNCTYRFHGDLARTLIGARLVLKQNLEVAHVFHGTSSDEKGCVGSIKGDHIFVIGFNLFIIEEPGHLDIPFLIFLF